MTSLMEGIIGGVAGDPQFPNAPPGWTPAQAADTARGEGLELGDLHWACLRALQEYYARQGAASVRLRGLHDALEERFHRDGGLRELYRLFPGGPVAQGCRIAGLRAPAGAADRGFGSVA